jgi:type II secretory pathway pseudopilin PulG
MCITKKTENGYSLVEVLIAISILMLAIVGPLTIAAKSIQTAQYARQQTTAFFLAQEGITAVNMFRNWYALQAYAGNTNPWYWASPSATDGASILDSFCFDSDGCGIDFRDGSLGNNDVDCNTTVNNPCILKLRSGANLTALYTHLSPPAGGVATPYTRTIRLTRQGANEVLVSVEVRWNTKYLGNTTQNVTLRTSLFNIYEDL